MNGIEIQKLKTQVEELKTQVSDLQKLLTTRGVNNELSEMIRDVVFFDIDTTTTTTQSIGSVPANVPKNPNFFLKGYFRGKPFYIGGYNNP